MSVQYKSLHKGILLRLYLIYFIFLLAALVIIARIIDIQFVQGDYWKEQFNKQAIKAFIIPATKGNIYSSDGSLLATSIPKFDIYFDALACQSDSIYYKNIDKLAYHLDTLTKGFNNFKILLKKAREKKIRYLPIIKNVSYQELKIIKEFPLFNLGRNLGGLIIEEKDKRILPNGDLAARTIGFERIPAFDVIMNLSKIPDVIFEKQVDSLAICMSQLFIDKKKEYYIDILKKAKKNNSKKFMLAKNIRKDKLDKLFTTYLISQGQNKWIKIDTVIKQFYVGIEGAYREYLKGKEGLQIRKKLANGLWKPLFDENQIEPENGCDVISTINLNLQDVASSSLKSHLIAQGAEGGCAILMEVETGYIKAISNLKRTKEGEYKEIYNYAISASAEPGSTFKLVSIMAALEDGKIDTSDMIYIANGERIFYGKPIKDSHREPTNKISLKTAFTHSSNVGIASMVYEAYSKNPKRFIQLIKGMSILEPLCIELTGETTPYINPNAHETSIAIGYGVSLTPLQILAFYNAVANNGKMVKPLFVNEIKKASKTIKKIEPYIINPAICSPTTIEKVKKLLEGVVEEGTAQILKKSPYSIAGKTGTAKVAREDGKGGYVEGSYRAMFVGYFPADKPKYSCIVVVYQPDSAYYASKVAVPVFKDIADKVYAADLSIQQRNDETKYVKIPFLGKGYQNDLATIYKHFGFFKKSPYPNSLFVDLIMSNTTNKIYIKPVYNYNNKMPDFKGMGVRDAVFFAEKLGLKVNLIGTGKVVYQIPIMGSSYKKGDMLTLKLERI